MEVGIVPSLEKDSGGRTGFRFRLFCSKWKSWYFSYGNPFVLTIFQEIL